MDEQKCAVSGCKNQAIAGVEHDKNPFSVPLCEKHLQPYIAGFATEAFKVSYYKRIDSIKAIYDIEYNVVCHECKNTFHLGIETYKDGYCNGFYCNECFNKLHVVNLRG